MITIKNKAIENTSANGFSNKNSPVPSTSGGSIKIMLPHSCNQIPDLSLRRRILRWRDENNKDSDKTSEIDAAAIATIVEFTNAFKVDLSVRVDRNTSLKPASSRAKSGAMMNSVASTISIRSPARAIALRTIGVS